MADVTPIDTARRKRDRVLPHNLDAEASILGGIILRNDVLGHLETIEVDHFYDHRHKVVFQAMRNLEAIGRPIDIVTLEGEIQKQGKLEALGGVAFLGELALRVPTPDNVVSYAKIVRDRYLLRRLMLVTSDVAERGYAWDDEPDELLGQALADLQQLERGYREASEKIPIITVGASLEELDRLARTPVYETPFPAMNEVLGFGGLLSGQLYYLAGGTGFGKTSWVCALVKHHAEREQHALVAYYEMFSGYYTARMAAGPLGVAANQILRGEVPLIHVHRAVPAAHLEFLDGPSMPTLRRAIERHTRLGRPAPLVVVDYLQLLANQIQATMTRPDPRLANAMASEGLRSVAKDTGAAILVVSAASRTTGKKLANSDVRKVAPRDLVDSARESGAIEYDGAGIIVLSVSDEKDGDENIATITVAKARFGEAAHLDARYDGRTGSWRELGRVSFAPALGDKAPQAAAVSRVRAAITRVLRSGAQESKSKIQKLSGGNRAAVFSEIDAMLDDGTLVLQGGKIALAGVGATQVPGPVPQLEIGGGPA